MLEDISFSVAPAETRILLGPAGVGKSVLLKLIIGLLRPLEGAIQLFGEDISHMPEEKPFPLRSRAGMVFQEGALFDSLTVRDNVAYQLIQERVPDEEIDSRVHEALSFVGLEANLRYVSRKPFGRHEAARGHRPRPHPRSGADPVRLADRGPGSGHLHHHHRTDRQAARRARDPVSAGYPPPSGCFHAVHSPLRSGAGIAWSRFPRARSTPTPPS